MTTENKFFGVFDESVNDDESIKVGTKEECEKFVEDLVSFGDSEARYLFVLPVTK